MESFNIYYIIALTILGLSLFVFILIFSIHRRDKRIKEQLNMAIDIGKIDIRDNNGKFLTVDKLFNLLKNIKKLN